MSEVITIGETMATFSPNTNGSLRYVKDFALRIAGAESNTAIGIQKLGHSAEWFSRIGNDELGQFILNSIRSEGVKVKNCVFDSDHRTGLMVKEFHSKNETRVHYYRDNSAASHLAPEDIDDIIIKNSKILHITGITPVLSDICLSSIMKAIDLAKQYDVMISFDPNIRMKLWGSKDYTDIIKKIIANSSIIMLGLDEAYKLFGTMEVDDIFSRLFQNKNMHFVAIKDGSKGAYVATKNETHFIAPYPCNCIDPVGAGDAFNAGFLVGILENHSIQTCGKMAGIAGAFCTQTTGDIEGIPSKQELINLLNNQVTIAR